MRSGFLLCLAGLTLAAATSTPAQTSPIQTIPVPAPAAPVPTQQSPDATPSRPAYDPDAKPTPPVFQPAPIPQPAPPPVILKPEPPPPGKPKYTPSEIFTAYEPYGPYGPPGLRSDHGSSPYIPMDSWVYPEMMRLYGMGYINSAFLSLRPWTRRSVLHMLGDSQDAILAGDNQEAQAILAVLLHELDDEQTASSRDLLRGTQTAYTRVLGVGGNTLRDSYHLGQTIINDYGRPYQKGVNAVAGITSRHEWGRLSLDLRAEYQHAPGGDGYSPILSSFLSYLDAIPYTATNLNQATIPTGPIAAQNPFRIVEATLSFHLLGHEFSGGKTDAWLGPGTGGGMAWSNNAENIYNFRINRVEPLHIPLVSRVTGPIRYDFFIGSLKGHTYPNHPWIHSEIISFAPTKNFQFGFQRSIIFGGAGHEPVTLHTFFKGFFSISDTTMAEKFSRDDPGARFGSFNFSYRPPLVSRYLTFYADSITHDDVNPVSAPRRAAYRTGLYLSHVPRLNKLDLRAEAVVTDFSTHASDRGGGNYYETIQRQGYTNKGYILGDWIGREAKGGQAWLTYHLSGNESVQLEYLNKKTPKDFTAGGTTQNSFKATVVKRFGSDFEVNAWLQYERWKAPIYLPGLQTNTTGAVQLTWTPKIRPKL